MRKAADLTLKTLSKVKMFATTLACVCVCVYMCACLSTFSLSRCAPVCVSLQALEPRELWR